MNFGNLIRAAALVGMIGSTAGAIDVYTGTTLTPESAAATDSAADAVTSRRLTALRRREFDHVTSKPVDVVYSATVDATTGQPAPVIYATRLDPVTGRPLDVFSLNERKSSEWVASTQLDPATGKPIGTVYARRFDVRTGRPLDIVRTVPLRTATAPSPRSALPGRQRIPGDARGQAPIEPAKTQPAAERVKPAAAPAGKPEPAKTASVAESSTAPKAAAKPVAPARQDLAGTWWCVAPSWSSGVIELASDGTYTRPDGAKGTYRIQGSDVIFDGPLKSWDNGRARFEGGNLIFEWTNPDGAKNYFAFRKG